MLLCGKKMLLILAVSLYSYKMNLLNSSIGLNLSPAANEAGATFTPKLNMFANNLTRWDLYVGDVQV